MARQHRSTSSIVNTSVIAIALGLALPGIAGAQTNSTWNGTTGNWTNAAERLAQSGTFANAPVGQQFFVGTFGGQSYNAFVSYSSNSVVLSSFALVPEPTHVLLAAGAMGAVGWWRRRR